MIKKLIFLTTLVALLCCAETTIADFHADRDYDSAVMWPTSMVDYPTNGWFVEGYEVQEGTAISCVTFDMCAKIDVLSENRTMDIVIMSSNEKNEPLNVIYEQIGFQLPDSMVLFPEFQEIIFNLPENIILNEDSYLFFGFRPNFGEDMYMYFIGSDENNWGKSWTLSSREGWIPVSKNWPFVRSIGIGICAEPICPVGVNIGTWGDIKNLYLK